MSSSESDYEAQSLTPGLVQREEVHQLVNIGPEEKEPKEEQAG